VLSCDQCGYDLSGLAKGPDDVACPECGWKTPHLGGRPIGPESAWNAIGLRRWAFVLPPGIVSLLVPLGIWLASIDGGYAAQLALVGVLLTGISWVCCIVAAAQSPRSKRYSRRERRVFVVFVAILSAMFVPVVWSLVGVVLEVCGVLR
jgi:hypothetical protein